MLGKTAGYTTTQGQILGDLFSAAGYNVECASSRINRVARMLDIVITLVFGARKFDVVVLDSYSGLNFVVADVTSLLCKVLRLPLVQVLRGGNFPQFVRTYPRWTRFVLKRASVLVAPSEYLADTFRKLGFEVSVITNVVNFDNYIYRERSKIAPHLIWMRSFHSIYNPEMAVRVLAKLRESEPGATLVMAGSEKGLRDKVENMVRELGLSGAVRIEGFLDQKGKIEEFSKANIYLCTNRIDNMPVSVIEARAFGLPVVATNVGGLPYLIRHGIDGFLVPSDDVDAMVESIKGLLQNPALTKAISSNGRALAERSSWKAVRPELEKLFGDVLDSRAKSGHGKILDSRC